MTIRIHSSIHELRASFHDRGSEPVILVPTMGALHTGHEVLIHRAKEVAPALVPALQSGPVPPRIIVSIFVNPLQFGPKEDFARYPRDLQRDAAIGQSAGATDIFAPSPEELTPGDVTTSVDPGSLANVLCGPFRPGHFRGVCTIVLKLFNVVQPTHAIFGWKDAQQFIILRKMVKDLNLPIEMIGVETERESDGLAMSSRNAYLSPEERRIAPALHRTLEELREALLCGAILPADTEAFARVRLQTAGITPIDYVQLVSAGTLGAPEPTGELLLAGAMRLGTTRLIDNVRFFIP
ncbi:MAG: pantoate--beta-alanine ligase [Candidatus Sumerlaeaceae bacterium]